MVQNLRVLGRDIMASRLAALRHVPAAKTVLHSRRGKWSRRKKGSALCFAR